MAMKMAATALLLVLAIVPATVIAETYTVGDSAQWDSGVDYTTWVTGKTFKVGDTLEFKYSSLHSVNEVDADSCSGKLIKAYSSGDDKIKLDKVGSRYFICPTPGHCGGGMKLAVSVVAASSGTPAGPTPPSSNPGTPSTPAAGTPATPTSGSSSPPPPKASGATKGLVSYVFVGVSMVFGYGLWF